MRYAQDPSLIEHKKNLVIWINTKISCTYKKGKEKWVVGFKKRVNSAVNEPKDYSETGRKTNGGLKKNNGRSKNENENNVHTSQEEYETTRAWL